MWFQRLTLLITALRENAVLRTALLVVYYLLIIAALVALYGKGDFTIKPFVYQGF